MEKPKTPDPRLWSADSLKAGMEQWWHAVEGSRRALDQLGQQLQATARSQTEAVRSFTKAEGSKADAGKAEAAPPSSQQSPFATREDVAQLVEALELLEGRRQAGEGELRVRLGRIEEAVGALAAQIEGLAQTVAVIVANPAAGGTLGVPPSHPSEPAAPMEAARADARPKGRARRA